ncbi:MAG TPA: reverse transcriptase family protein, partial [Methylomirabilota bacterium]|nr:reverse transcriptase family protein [Methylomirabilota bacterium]
MFKTPLGQYEPMVMNFGLRNTPATFQRMMNKLLRPIKVRYGEDVQGYMDNILIATRDNLTYHREVVNTVLRTMEDNSLFLKPEKCEFEKHRVEYLGILLEKETVQPDPSKIARLREWPTKLKSVKEVCSTLGVLRYQCTFIPGFSHIARPLTELLR